MAWLPSIAATPRSGPVSLAGAPYQTKPQAPGAAEETSPSSALTAGARAIAGTIKDRDSGRSLPGVRVQLVELNRVTFSDTDGRFAFFQVPRGEFTLGIHARGFSSVHRGAIAPGEGKLEFLLEPATVQEEIVVSASPFTINRLEVPQQVDVVSGETLKREARVSLGEALADTPGLANIPTGDALGTPVIRGLSENRIRVLNDGVPLNHQQFSWRHSPNVETSLAHAVEVVRGPMSVLYGPDAMGGIVNVVQPPLLVAPKGELEWRGEMAGAWGSNTDAFTGRAEIQGATGGLGWNLGFVNRDSNDIETPENTLENTDYRQNNGNLAIGYSADFGTVRVRLSHWELDTGFYRPVGFHLGLDDDLVAADVFVPTHWGDLELKLSQQTNIRKAFPAPLQGAAAVDLKQVTQSARAGWRHPNLGSLRGELAAEMLMVENDSRALGQLLPEYTSDGMALMVFEEGRFCHNADKEARLVLSLGLRWDSTDLSVPPDSSRNLPLGYSVDYDAWTGSLGGVFKMLPTLSLAANLGRGWRPPNAFELFANGVHNGVSAIQIGNPDLSEEANLNAELSLRYAGKRIQAYVTGYLNDFDDFIYLGDTGQHQDGVPVFDYRQDDAVIRGLEVSCEATIASWCHLNGQHAWIDTENKALNRPLPQEPARRTGLSARFSARDFRFLESASAEITVQHVGSQEVSGPDEPFGVATDPYTLWGLGGGCEWSLQRIRMGADLCVHNLLDETYTDFLYSYKAVAVNPGRDIRLTGRVMF